MTGLLLRVPAADHRALCTHDLTGLHPWGGTRAMAGKKLLAPGDAVDSAGVRVTDAAAAVDGAISPFGCPKGHALGLMTEVLVATSTRTALGDDVRGTPDPTAPPTRGDVFIAMDPRAPGHDRVREPGARLRHPAADAVPVSQVNWTSTQHITADVPERH
ncbi:Ldh family oxidoreductase [Actinacidiphila glaucinigra]|uniref:Malate/L-lactate dehydrogenase n=1 Tax=Actinacidiphila glaucinigra TaxID=235986 RepID=A0A239MSX1_9ACTN|nr:Ldh family oxidoreductase [Actinacidiphila glaucinigra]SNT44949.1 Malate/L-lactate dehydrogenase [Actinacidiphila glaucinigra]